MKFEKLNFVVAALVMSTLAVGCAPKKRGNNPGSVPEKAEPATTGTTNTDAANQTAAPQNVTQAVAAQETVNSAQVTEDAAKEMNNLIADLKAGETKVEGNKSVEADKSNATVAQEAVKTEVAQQSTEAAKSEDTKTETVKEDKKQVAQAEQKAGKVVSALAKQELNKEGNKINALQIFIARENAPKIGLRIAQTEKGSLSVSQIVSLDDHGVPATEALSTSKAVCNDALDASDLNTCTLAITLDKDKSGKDLGLTITRKVFGGMKGKISFDGKKDVVADGDNEVLEVRDADSKLLVQTFRVNASRLDPDKLSQPGQAVKVSAPESKEAGTINRTTVYFLPKFSADGVELTYDKNYSTQLENGSLKITIPVKVGDKDFSPVVIELNSQL